MKTMDNLLKRVYAGMRWY